MASAGMKNMFLSRMMAKDTAAKPFAVAPQSAPSTPPSSSGSPRGGGARARVVGSLSSSQPLSGAITEASLASLAPPLSASSSSLSASPPLSTRTTPGTRLEIYDLPTEQLRAELAASRRRRGDRAWEAWGVWIADELEERAAGEDILGAISAMEEHGDGGGGFSGSGGLGVGVGGGGTVVLDHRTDSVLSSPPQSPHKLEAAKKFSSRSGESEQRERERRVATAAINRSAGAQRGGARRNRGKHRATPAPAWHRSEDCPTAGGNAAPARSQAPAAAEAAGGYHSDPHRQGAELHAAEMQRQMAMSLSRGNTRRPREAGTADPTNRTVAPMVKLSAGSGATTRTAEAQPDLAVIGAVRQSTQPAGTAAAADAAAAHAATADTQAAGRAWGRDRTQAAQSAEEQARQQQLASIEAQAVAAEEAAVERERRRDAQAAAQRHAIEAAATAAQQAAAAAAERQERAAAQEAESRKAREVAERERERRRAAEGAAAAEAQAARQRAAAAAVAQAER
jgi:hypothetical protein